MSYRLTIGSDVIETESVEQARLLARALWLAHDIPPRWDTPIPPVLATPTQADTASVEAWLRSVREHAGLLYGATTWGLARRRLLAVYDYLGVLLGERRRGHHDLPAASRPHASS